MKDPQFLCSILPISPELNGILRRVFENDAHRRISIEELRDLIISCPRLTTTSYDLPLTPPSETSAPSTTYGTPASADWYPFETSKQTSSHSSHSTDSGYESAGSCHQDPSCPAPVFNFYGNTVPYLDGPDKPSYHHPGFTSHPVVVY